MNSTMHSRVYEQQQAYSRLATSCHEPGRSPLLVRRLETTNSTRADLDGSFNVERRKRSQLPFRSFDQIAKTLLAKTVWNWWSSRDGG